jgi:hypothetical protein
MTKRRRRGRPRSNHTSQTRNLRAAGPPGADRRTLRLRTPEDLLAVVPYSLGFHPTDSLVIVTSSPGRPFFARIDLPPDPADLGTVVEQLLEAAVRNRVSTAVLAVYSADAGLAEAAHDELRAGCEDAGIELPLAIRADGARWFCLHGPSGAAHRCPVEGTPYDVRSHMFTAQAVLDGRVIQPSREALRDSLVGNDPDDAGAVGDAVDAAVERMLAAARTPLGQPAAPDTVRRHLVQEGHWVRRRVRRFLDDQERLDVEDAGRMLTAITAIQVRDVAWSEMTRETAETHLELWRDLVRRSPAETLAPPAALLGFAAWLAGQGALAWCAVERCQLADPDYSMAGLITQALAGAVPPDTWTPLDESTLSLFAG